MQCLVTALNGGSPGGGSGTKAQRTEDEYSTGPTSNIMGLVGVLSDVNLHFIVQTYPLARMKFMTIQDI